ncbi:MAG: amidohydrolase [Caldiserica bacterium]|nr:MAG: amidohydrolase [Caldisericota bacterium]
MEKSELKKIVLDEIERRKEEIVSLCRSIYEEPEEGFREFKTKEKLKSFFAKENIPYEEFSITGIKGKISGKGDINIGIFSEMDALFNPSHPDSKNGLVHACGHFAQIGYLLGVALGINRIKEHLSGNIFLFGTPAEEFIDLSFREKLKNEGKIRFFGGKQEMIREGVIKDVHIGIMAHGDSSYSGRYFTIRYRTNGFISKMIKFKGKPSHAGAEPEKGVNALHIMTLSINAINMLRERFKDKEHIRVHYISTKGGDSVNIIPDDVRMEMYVRGSSIDAILSVDKLVDRAIVGSSYALNGDVTIKTIPGYLPLIQNDCLSEIFKKNAEEFGIEVKERDFSGASTDMGDVSHLIPVIHPSFSGFSGDFHGDNFKMVDEEMALIIPAKVIAMTLIDLLYDGAKNAKKILDSFTPLLTRERYLSLMNGLERETTLSSEIHPKSDG